MSKLIMLSNREKELLKYLLEYEIKSFGDNEKNLLRIEYEKIFEKVQKWN